MLALRTEEGKPLPGIAWPLPGSMTLAAAPPATVTTLGLPVSSGCPCGWPTASRQSSRKHSTLATIYCSSWVTSPSPWTQGS